MRYLLLFFVIFNVSAQETCNTSNIKSDEVSYIVSTSTVVGSERSYFYSSPAQRCKGKLFLIPGDKVVSYKKYNGYRFIHYVSKKGDNVSGWMKQDNITDYTSSRNELNNSDFILYFIDAGIYLGEPISHVMNSLKKNNEPVSYNLVGNTEYGDVFSLDFPVDNSASIYFSSFNSKIRGDNEGEIISQITLYTQKYKTKRGIAVGSGFNDVIRMYGAGEKDDDKTILYSYADMMLSFQFDEKNKVKMIMYSIKPCSKC